MTGGRGRIALALGLHGLGQCHDAGEPLSQGVVDFPGQPFPLGGHPGLA